ncbi:hypothetical protein ISCGN_022040 [Ixodes scapularis]
MPKLEPFLGESKDKWEEYEEVVEQYFIANDIAGEKKRAVFLSNCGKRTYSLLRNLLAPERPRDVAYDDIITKLNGHYAPKLSIIVELLKFHTRIRQQGETMSDFIASLRKLADSCDFKILLNDMLRDRLVCGINNDLMQTRLLEDAELTFEKAVKVVVAMEAATKDSQAIACRAGTTSAVETNRLSEQSSRMSRCRHCGKSHGSAACRYANMTCHNCKKVGHLSAVCTARSYDESSSVKKDGKAARDYQNSPGRRSKKAPSAVTVHSLDDPNNQDSDDYPPTYNGSRRTRHKPTRHSQLVIGELVTAGISS